VTDEVAPVTRKGGGLHPPAKWVCPQCGAWVRTHVTTYPVECRKSIHSPKGVTMEAIDE
jgi:hypothetical protein